MWEIALDILKRYWQLALFAVAAGACYFFHLHNVILKEQVTTRTAQVQDLQSKLRLQNTEVDSLRKKQADLVQQVQQRQQQLDQAANNVRIEYRDRVQRVVIQQPPVQCDSAAAWAADQVKSLLGGQP